jgi:2-keto-3-deoxy-L-rhamnonate aldolase RhmA
MPNKLKHRLAKGGTVIGAWLQTSSPTVAEVMATCGFDWLVVDMEHGTAGVEQASFVFAVAERHGATPVVRLPSADAYLARRLLDAGAQGLLVPVVEDVKAFKAFLAHCLYPPKGKRGLGLVRANRWGGDFDAYMSGFRPLIVPMIETAKGAAAADAIAKLADVDGLFLGPYDLSADLGRPGDFTTPAFAKAAAQVKKACDDNGKAAGFHQVEPDVQALKARMEQGYRLLAFGTDVVVLRHAFRDVGKLKKVKKARKAKRKAR